MAIRSDFLVTTLGFTKYINVDVAMKGWAMSPVHKSVNANPLRNIWNGVLTNVFFQIAAKINAFPATATGDKTAMIVEVANEKINAVLGLFSRKSVVL